MRLSDYDVRPTRVKGKIKRGTRSRIRLTVRSHFLQHYRAAFATIPGFFTFEAALLFMSYNQLNKHGGIAGDVLEIGVHYGLSAIAVAGLRSHTRGFLAIDLFEKLQDQNVSGSGAGSERAFIKNMRSFYDDLSFMRTIVRASADVEASELGQGFSFCHIDGGHSAAETYQDLTLCAEISSPGGLIAVDDYFNPEFPGVCEGAVRFYLERPGILRPTAIGFNKVLWQKEPASLDLNAEFAAAFPAIPQSTAMLWGTKVSHFTTAFSPFFDLTISTPEALFYRNQQTMIAEILPITRDLHARASTKAAVEVRVKNKSSQAFPFGQGIFGLSYHLLSPEGGMLKYNNGRTYFKHAVMPEEEVSVSLDVLVPDQTGEYWLELDLVWENVCWFKDDGNPTPTLRLTVA